MIRTPRCLGIIVLAVMEGFGLASGDTIISPPFQITSEGEAATLSQTITWGPESTTNTSYSSPTANSSSSGQGEFSTANAHTSAVNGVFKAFADANTSCGPPFPDGQSSCFGTDALADISSSDLVMFGGLPVGTPEEFEISITLNSTVTNTGNGMSGMVTMTATGGLFFSNDGSTCVTATELALSNNGSNNGIWTCNAVISTSSGSSMPVDGDLLAEVNVAAFLCSNCSYGGTADAQNTGAISLIPLTPGATFTTASGLTYPPFVESTPEPGYLWLSGAGIVIVCAIRRITANEAK